MGLQHLHSHRGAATSALATMLDRLSQAFHRKFDVGGLQLVPALDLGLVALLRDAFEIFGGQFPGGRALSGEFFADKRISWHRAIEAQTMAHGQSAKRLGWCSPALFLLFSATGRFGYRPAPDR